MRTANAGTSPIVGARERGVTVERYPGFIELLELTIDLLAAAVAHRDLHPEAYANPSGRLVSASIDTAANRLLRRSSAPGASVPTRRRGF